MTAAGGMLSADERRILAIVCDAFCPRLESGPDESPELFGTSASDLGVPAALEQAMTRLGAGSRRELRLFIRLLDSPAFMLLLTRIPRGITRMAPDERERALLALSRSAVPQARTGFQALKRLSTFLFYAVVGDDGHNRLWPALGYRLIPPAPARSRLRLTTIAEHTTLDADACVVGSGAGGGVVAARLAAAGLRVVVLEAGAADQAADYDQREIVGMQRLYLDQGTTASRDLGVVILAGSCVGGGTSINWQTSLRLPDYIRDEWAERSGVRAFADDRFTAALDAVCARLNVGTGESARNGNNAPLERGAAALRYHWSVIPRNARGCDLAQCGYCMFGCRTGGKQSTAVTYLVDAQARGQTTIVGNCRAERVRVVQGAVNGVTARYRDPASGALSEVQVNAPRVIVAAGAIETPALLLRSGVRHPQLGRNLYLHPTTAVAGWYDEPVQGWIGAPQSVLCDELARVRGNYGVRIEAAPIHPGLFALATPWHGARAHRVHLQRIAAASAFVAITRDQRGGHVVLDQEGRAVVHYTVGRTERDLLTRGMVAAARLHEAAGAAQVHTVHGRPHGWHRAAGDDFAAFCHRVSPSPLHGNRGAVLSAHQMGTCRMGTDARTAVCDERGQVRGTRGLHVADASLFPASSGVNPMITIMALAQMVADGLTV